MLDQPTADARASSEADIEDTLEAAEDVCTRAWGRTVAQICRSGGLEGGPTAKGAFNDGCDE